MERRFIVFAAVMAVVAVAAVFVFMDEPESDEGLVKDPSEVVPGDFFKVDKYVNGGSAGVVTVTVAEVLPGAEEVRVSVDDNGKKNTMEMTMERFLGFVVYDSGQRFGMMQGSGEWVETMDGYRECETYWGTTENGYTETIFVSGASNLIYKTEVIQDITVYWYYLKDTSVLNRGGRGASYLHHSRG